MGKSRFQEFQEHVASLSQDERHEALSAVVGQVYLATEMVTQQSRRLRESERVTHTEHQSDAVLFVFALQLLLVLLRLVHDLATPERRGPLDEAMDRLNRVAGDAGDARDVLAHLDEYLTGFGKKQSDAGARPLPWFSRNGSQYTVRVGEYAIDVEAADSAAIEAFAAAFPLEESA